MKKFIIYIGENHKTGRLELQKTYKILQQTFDSFTTYETFGFWKGKKIRTLKIEILTNKTIKYLKNLCKKLTKKLEQEIILLEETSIKIYLVSC